MERVVRVSVWAVFGFGFVVIAALAALTALTSKPAFAQPAKAVKSKIKVTVPQDDAKLEIEKKEMKTTGKTREFDSPDLEATKKYEYEFVVKWEPNNYTKITRTKTVQFVAGDEVVVDLTKEEGKDKAEIRYVPTPPEVVEALIKLGKVGKDDVVFEPGCGDARMIIASVKAGAKKAVGIDRDPDRIKEANANVKEAGLGDKIDIRMGDALEVKDYGDASVILLYMGDEFDLLIRPTLLRDLKVGSRILSHRFKMGDWKPDDSKKITGTDGEEYEIHLWTVTEDAKKKYAAPKK